MSKDICKFCIWNGINIPFQMRLIFCTYNSVLKKKNSIRSKQMTWINILQRRYTHGQKHMKICSVPLIIREMQIKTTVWYQFTPISMPIIPKEKNKQTKKRNVFENVEKFKLLYTAGENVK